MGSLRSFLFGLSLLVLMGAGFSGSQPSTVSTTTPITGDGSAGSPLGMPAATGAVAGYVSTDTQTFGGTKTFSSLQCTGSMNVDGRFSVADVEGIAKIDFTAATGDGYFEGDLTANGGDFSLGSGVVFRNSTGDVRIDAATGKSLKYYVNNVLVFSVASNGDITIGSSQLYGMNSGLVKTNQIYGPTNTTQIKINSSLAAADAQADLLITSQNVRSAGKMLDINNNGGSSLFSVNYTGAVVAAGNITGAQLIATGGVYAGDGNVSANAANTQLTLGGKINSGSALSTVRIYNQNGTAAGDFLLKLFSDNAAATLVSSIDRDGLGTFNAGVKVSSGSTAMTYSLTATSVIDFGSLTATCADSAAIAVTSAAFGDQCSVGMSAAPAAGATVSCYVSSAGNVMVRACAPGAVIDLASMTYTVRVIR